MPHKPKSQDKKVMSISDYVQKREDYKNLPGRMICGELLTFYNGMWLTRWELDVMITKPNPVTLYGDMKNCDKTKLYLYE